MAYFKLFACCKLIRGASRSVIMDVQRGSYETIPNDLLDIVQNFNGMCIEDILLKFNFGNKIIVKDFYKFLIDNEYGFWCESLIEFEQFLDINDYWDNPSPITNVIIDIGNDSKIDYLSLIDQIKQLAIPNIQIRSSVSIDFSFYESLIIALEKSRIISVELIIPFVQNDISLEQIKRFVRRNLRIKKVIFHSSSFNKKVKILNNLSDIYFTKKKYSSVADCGVINKNYFSVNMEHYTESRHYNSCLNRKISIDINGKIKNCPSMSKCFGNIKESSLKSVLEKNPIDSLWHITKDKIDVCKDCEFRYMCTDCRAYLKDDSDQFSQPQKCTYNPFIAKWKGEKGYSSIENWRKMQI